MSLDNAAMTIYGDSISGNCLKVKFVADRLGLPYDWVEISVLKGETRTPEFLAMNPAGQVPVVRVCRQWRRWPSPTPSCCIWRRTPT